MDSCYWRDLNDLAATQGGCPSADALKTKSRWQEHKKQHVMLCSAAHVFFRKSADSHATCVGPDPKSHFQSHANIQASWLSYYYPSIFFSSSLTCVLDLVVKGLLFGCSQSKCIFIESFWIQCNIAHAKLLDLH